MTLPKEQLREAIANIDRTFSIEKNHHTEFLLPNYYLDRLVDFVTQYSLSERYKSEVWLPYTVFPFEGEYEVSSAGRVRRNGKILAQSSSNPKKENWYRTVSLSKNNIQKTANVHRLVAQTFLINDTGKPQVNHIDGDKTNNVLSNLEWATYSENERHSWDVLGKTAYNKGVDNTITLVCPVCNTFLKVYPDRGRKYCSVRCANSVNVKTRRPKGARQAELNQKKENP